MRWDEDRFKLPPFGTLLLSQLLSCTSMTNENSGYLVNILVNLSGKPSLLVNRKAEDLMKHPHHTLLHQLTLLIDPRPIIVRRNRKTVKSSIQPLPSSGHRSHREAHGKGSGVAEEKAPA
ncbi:hypothetical protein HPP92_024139 [Vanilla planifolia]|uniref:Uncharacterized protein n=1 Tax=Vanilla planifolia TaxID=51239 RepID=A0A835PJQ7_VANPL|nr:hypothetical protein HPP92_024472 [Vanilla planifolia]KAG0456351.1 hypothetical protein HPP92_024139 [Vanilla planifolia]